MHIRQAEAYLFHSFEGTIMTSLVLLRLSKCEIKSALKCITHTRCTSWRGWPICSTRPNLLEWEKITVRRACNKQSVCALFVLCQDVDLFRSTLLKGCAVAWQYVDPNLIKIDNQLEWDKESQWFGPQLQQERQSRFRVMNVVQNTRKWPLSSNGNQYGPQARTMPAITSFTHLSGNIMPFHGIHHSEERRLTNLISICSGAFVRCPVHHTHEIWPHKFLQDSIFSTSWNSKDDFM